MNQKVIVPKIYEYPLKRGELGYHPIDEKNHYTNILVKIFGEQKGYECGIFNVELTDDFLIITVGE